jgi:hypothetical protein
MEIFWKSIIDFFLKNKTTNDFGADWQSTMFYKALLSVLYSNSSNYVTPLMFQAGVGFWNTDHSTVVVVLIICFR